MFLFGSFSFDGGSFYDSGRDEWFCGAGSQKLLTLGHSSSLSLVNL